MPNITQIPANRVPFLNKDTGLMSREWYMFFQNLFNLTGAGSNDISLTDLQLGPVLQDTSGELGIIYDQSQLAQIQSDFQKFSEILSSQPSCPQLGTISSFDLINSPSLGSVIYGTGSNLSATAVGTSGQVLTSQGSGTPVWSTPITYETGDFTPGITFGNLAVGITYATQSGRYTRIGRSIHFTINIVLTSKGSSTGTLRITPLPFTCGNLDYAVSTIDAGMQGTVATMVMAQVLANTVNIQLYKFATGSVSSVNDADLTGTDTIKVSGYYDI